MGRGGEQNLGGVKPWEFPNLELKVIFAWIIGVLIGFYFSSAQVWMLRCELRTGKSEIQSGKCQRERKHNFTSSFLFVKKNNNSNNNINNKGRNRYLRWDLSGNTNPKFIAEITGTQSVKQRPSKNTGTCTDPAFHLS